MNRYSVEKGLAQGKTIDNLLKDILLPPTVVVDAPLTDIYNFLSPEREGKMKTLGALPVFGQLTREWFTDAGLKAHLKRKREYILNEIKENGRVSPKIRKVLLEYNKDVRKLSDENLNVIKGSTITNAIKQSKDK